jgi:hypothetical protein
MPGGSLEMLIQETDRILKESRIARNAAARHHVEDRGLVSRALRKVAKKLTGLFRRRGN